MVFFQKNIPPEINNNNYNYSKKKRKEKKNNTSVTSCKNNHYVALQRKH